MALVGRAFCTRATARHSFITTPIFYVNAAPHIGHLYSAVLADAAHRWQRMKGVETTVFSTGTDEHGLKVQKAAVAQNCTPMELCDRVSARFKELFDLSNVKFSDYIRTTEKRHIHQVEKFWYSLYEKGCIYKGRYEGWYSVSDEMFVSNTQVTDGEKPGEKVAKETGNVVEWHSEENYLFRLPLFREKLLEWVNTHPYPVIPESARQQVLQWLTNETTSDLSVSRPRTRLAWGIKTPIDNTQTIYVWLDALINYLTVSKYPHPGHCWPPTAHVVGKDILRFHAVYWPAFLLAAGVELPQRIISHAHWTMGKTKMSKSKGNVVDPLDQISQFGVDPLRYFLLKEGSLHQDGDYSEERVGAILNADLADTMGNLLQRVTSRKLNIQGPSLSFSTELFPLGVSQRETASVRAGNEDYTLVNRLIELPDVVGHHYEDFEFNKGITAIMDCLHQTNRFLERHKPWHLATMPSDLPWLGTVLCVAMESLRLCSALLYPIIPSSSSEIIQRLGFSRVWDTPWCTECSLKDKETVGRLVTTCEGLQLGGQPLFRKV